MSQIIGILEALPDVGARIRVAEWVHERVSSQRSPSDRVAAYPSQGDSQPKDGDASPLEAIGSHTSVESFLKSKLPRTKTERLVCLLFWATAADGPNVAVRTLDVLNRQAGGDTFSDAGSLAQQALAKGYVRRSRPGHFALTSKGQGLVASLPPPAAPETPQDLAVNRL